MEELIRFEKVSKCYQTGEQNFMALDHISLSILKGEFVVILGPSGAGKSTLLNVLGGMDTVTSGHIYVASDDITTFSKNDLAGYRAENVGFIFQFYNILPTLTVLENVELMKDIVKHPKNAEETLSLVGLREHFHKFPGQLSGGEQQRVSIARAISKNPKLLLCDEPTGALDSKTGVDVLRLLKECCREENGGNTVIIVTHNQLIAEIADRIIHIKNGQIASNLKNSEIKNVDEVNW